MADQNFSKTDQRYGQDRIFKPTYTKNGRALRVEDWAARMQWRGRREVFNFKTSNKAAAAAKDKDIYTMLVGLAGLKLWRNSNPKPSRSSLQRSAISWLNCRDIGQAEPKHLMVTAEAFDQSCHKSSTSRPEISDYVNGGRKAWIWKIDRIKLADVTPDKVNRWRVAFAAKAGASRVAQRRARISCNSMMRHS